MIPHVGPRVATLVLAAIAVSACGGVEEGSVDAGATDVAPATVEPREELEPAVSTSACPPTMPTEGASCPCAFSCEYGSEYDVLCDTLMTGSHGQWTVTQRPNDAGCLQPGSVPPAAGCALVRPRIGTACATPGQSCAYDACSGGLNLLCAGGMWEDSPL